MKVENKFKKLGVSLAVSGLMLAVPMEASAAGFAALFTSLQTQLTSAASFLSVIMAMAGGSAIAVGLFKAWKASDDHAQVTPKQIIVPLLAGGAMLAFGTVINMSQDTVTGGSTASTTGGAAQTAVKF